MVFHENRQIVMHSESENRNILSWEWQSETGSTVDFSLPRRTLFHADLSCVNDYMGNVSCVWNCSNQSSKAKDQCILKANIDQSSGKEYDSGFYNPLKVY